MQTILEFHQGHTFAGEEEESDSEVAVACNIFSLHDKSFIELQDQQTKSKEILKIHLYQKQIFQMTGNIADSKAAKTAHKKSELVFMTHGLTQNNIIKDDRLHFNGLQIENDL